MTAVPTPHTFSRFNTSIPAGSKSTAFDDQADAKGRQITGIDSINIWADKIVRGLQVTYTLANGKRYRAPLRGTQTGAKTRVRLEADEELIQLSGRGNTNSVTSLSLLSTKSDGAVRLHGPFGDGELPVKSKGKVVPYRNVEMLVGGSDDKGFSWYGCKVMAFVGDTRGGRLNGLGVLTAPIVEVAEGMSSTSVIAEDYRERRSGSKGQTKLETYSTYRSTVILPKGTKEVTLWAEEQLAITVDGRARTLDPVKATVIKPNAIGSITINVEATDISVPAIKIRTDQMPDPWQWYSLHPDVAVHAKIAAWDVDTLYTNRSKLGIPKKYTKEDCAAIQAAVVNVSKLGLPGEGQAAHERRVDAGNMDDANWMLDLDGEQLSYAPVNKAGAKQTKQQAIKVTKVTAARGIKKKYKKARKKAKNKAKKATGSVSKVVVETTKTKPVKAATKTVKKAGGGKIAKDAANLGKNVAKTGNKLAKDVAKGDVESFGKHLGQGGLQLGKDVTKLGKHTVVTIINVAGEAIEYVLDRTVALGKLMWEFLKSIGAKLMKLIKFLIDLIPWKAIARTQKQLMSALEASLGAMNSAKTDDLIKQIEGFFDDLREGGEDALDKLTLQLGGKIEPSGGIQEAGNQASAKAKKLDKSAGKAMKKVTKILSKPLELVNWLINKLLENIPVLGQLAKMLATAAKKIKAVIADIFKSLGKAMKVLPPALGSSLTNLMQIIKKPADAPNYIASAVLQLAKGVMGASLELVSEMISAVFRGFKTLAQLLLDLGKTDLFPGKKKKGGKVPFITDFYNLMVGGKLSLFKMITLLLAIPITLVHLIVFGSAPSLKLAAKRANKEKVRETSYVVAGAICSAGELAAHAFLDAIDLTRGIDAYQELDSGTAETFADKNPKATLALEIGALTCGVLNHYFSNPYEFSPAPKKGKDIADHVFYWIGAAQLGLDIIGLVVDQKRMVRADLADNVEGREGAWGTLAFEFCMLVAQASVAIAYKRKGPGIASDLLGAAGSTIEAGILSIFPKSNEKAAAACVATDLAFGLASMGTGLAADLG